MEVDLGFFKICLMVLSMMWEGNETLIINLHNKTHESLNAIYKLVPT